jgi:site-specific DNA recombinase
MSRASTSSNKQSPLRAALLIRVSTGRQAAEGLSLEAQRASGERVIAQHNWTLVEVYEEAGVSGRRDERPVLDRALQDAERGSFDVLVVPKLDRLGRSARNLHENFARLDAAGVQLHAIDQAIDTSSASGRLMRTVLSGLAEFESETIGERVSAVSERRAQTGGHHGPAPYGFRSEGPTLVAEPFESQVVRRIFAEYRTGRSQRQIAIGLNEDGVPPPRSISWGQPTIHKILANPAYAGNVRLNDVEYQGAHAAIVDSKTWNDTAALRSSNLTHGNGHGRLPVGRHLFVRGLLRCGVCFSPMYTRTDRDRAGDHYEVYYCSTNRSLPHEHPDHCPMPVLERGPIDKAALDYFAEFALDVDAARERISAASDRKIAEARSRREGATLAVAAADAALARIQADYLKGELSAQEWRDLSSASAANRQTAAAEAAEWSQREDLARQAADSADLDVSAVRTVSELQSSVVLAVRNAEGLAEVRVTMKRLFNAFVITPKPLLRGESHGPPASLQAYDSSRGALAALSVGELGDFDWWLEPMPNPAAFAPWEEGEPLALQRVGMDSLPGNNDYVGLQT